MRHSQGPTLVHVNPLLNNAAARASMQPAVDFATARGGSVVVEELPSWLAFFSKYVTMAQAVRPFPVRLLLRRALTWRACG